MPRVLKDYDESRATVVIYMSSCGNSSTNLNKALRKRLMATARKFNGLNHVTPPLLPRTLRT